MTSIIALPAPIALTLAERARGWAALAAATVILKTTRARPEPLRRVLERCAEGTEAATFAQASRADQVIGALSPRCAGGHHCFTRSIAVALYCRTLGTFPIWKSGVRFPPFDSHAWIETEGRRTVGESGLLTATYTPTITISGG